MTMSRNKRNNKYVRYSDGFYTPVKHRDRDDCVQYSDGFYTPPENSRENQPLDFIRKEKSCCLYSIAQKTDVDLKYAPIRPFCTQTYWTGGAYYTMGSEFESVNEQLNSDIIAIVHEVDKVYRGTPGNMVYTGRNRNTKSYIYLYSKGNLYLMESSGHPDVPRNSYSFSKELCTNESHINIVKREIEQVLSQQETSAPVLTKKRTPLNNPNNK